MVIDKSDEFQGYIETVCLLIKNKDVHNDIKLELEDHLETLKEEFIASGASYEEAALKAIAHMGDASVIGRQLNSTHKAKLDLRTLIPVIALSVFGLVSMYILQANSLNSRLSDMRIFQKSLIFYILGILIMLGLYFFDYRKLLPYSKYVYIVTLMLLVFTLFFGNHVNGMPFLSIGNININFISVCPLILVTALAGIFHDWNWQSTKGYLIALGIIAVPGWLLLLVSSITTMLIYMIGCIALMLVSKLKLHLTLMPPAGLLSVLYIFIISEPYRTKRLFTFLNPQNDPQGMGWLYLQLHDTISSAGLLGNNTADIHSKIPELHTDFIFTYIAYTFGWLAAAIIIILILAFILRMVHVTSTAKHSYGRLLSAGFVAVLSTQFILSITTSLGISPFFGVSLPFMSFGGSHIIMDMASAGIILSVYRRRNLSNGILVTKTS
jgi:cell division protein FtsW (lipid II flippase)